jgi:hypothetical protein
LRLIRTTSSDVLPLALACAVVFAILAGITTPGTFTNDEAHYIATITALKGGTFRLEETAGLMASRELLSFGAFNYFSAVNATPVAPVAPPLYAFLALPFSYIGFRALILLNTVSFIATGVLVFNFTKRNAARRIAPWIALGLYWFASFSLEYAVGMWPHCIAVFLCSSALVLSHRATTGGKERLAFGAGFAVALACGIRYQEAIYAGLLAVAMIYWTFNPHVDFGQRDETALPLRAKRALKLVVLYGLGAVLPLATCAYVNHARLHSWNPLTKGSGYASPDALADTHRSLPREALQTFAMKVVDFSLTPPFEVYSGSENYRPSAESGAVVYAGVVKKALLQSSPWVMLALLGLALAWRSANGLPQRGRRELRGLSMIVFGTILAFSLAGVRRSEGFCFNMRYFLELMPIFAIATAWLVQRFAGWRPMIGIAFLCGALLALSALVMPAPTPVKHLVILRAPLVLAGMLAIASLHARRTDRGRWLGPVFVASVGYATLVHVGDDLLASLKVRGSHEFYMDLVASQLGPEKTALIAFWGACTPFAPLTLSHKLTIVDPFLDSGKSVKELSRELLARDFRLLVMPQKMPEQIVKNAIDGRHVREIQPESLLLFDVAPKPQTVD